MTSSDEQILYRDIDLTFTPHPLTGDISTPTNADAIKRALQILFQLRKWDIPFAPNTRNYVMDMLFDSPSMILINEMKVKIDWLIKNFEPRIKIDQIDIKENTEGNGFDIRVKYTIKSLAKQDTLHTFFERVR